MAKKRNRGGRDVSTSIASGTLPRPIRPLRPLTITTPLTASSLMELEDRRRFRPDRSIRAPASLQRKDTRLVISQTAAGMQRVAFADPGKVAMCVRRKIRKEVLHATRVAGKSGIKARRRNFWSDVKC